MVKIVKKFIFFVATTNLMIGSILTFDYKTADYFFLVGTTLFFFNSVLVLIEHKLKKKPDIYDRLL